MEVGVWWFVYKEWCMKAGILWNLYMEKNTEIGVWQLIYEVREIRLVQGGSWWNKMLLIYESQSHIWRMVYEGWFLRGGWCQKTGILRMVYGGLYTEATTIYRGCYMKACYVRNVNESWYMELCWVTSTNMEVALYRILCGCSHMEAAMWRTMFRVGWTWVLMGECQPLYEDIVRLLYGSSTCYEAAKWRLHIWRMFCGDTCMEVII